MSLTFRKVRGRQCASTGRVCAGAGAGLEPWGRARAAPHSGCRWPLTLLRQCMMCARNAQDPVLCHAITKCVHTVTYYDCYCVLCIALQVRGFPCDCQYSKYCDSQLGVLPPPRSAPLQQQDALQQDQQEQQHLQGQPNGPQQSIHVRNAQEQQQLQQSSAAGDTGKLPANTEAAAGGVEPGSSGRVAAQALEDAHVHQVSNEGCRSSSGPTHTQYAACLLCSPKYAWPGRGQNVGRECKVWPVKESHWQCQAHTATCLQRHCAGMSAT